MREDRYVITCAYMQDAYRILYNVNNMTIHWDIRPYISRSYLAIRFGNAVIELAVGDRGLIGRHYYKRISENDLYKIIREVNESLRLGHGGLFTH